LKYLLILILLVSNITYAEEIELIATSNDEDKEITTLYIDVDEENVIQAFGIITYLDNEILYKTQLATELGEKGVVLYKTRGRDVVKLYGQNVDGVSGGKTKLSYLYNGITKKRRKYPMELSLIGNEWSLTVEGQIVKELHFHSNRKPIIGVIGIKRIEVIQ